MRRWITQEFLYVQLQLVQVDPVIPNAPIGAFTAVHAPVGAVPDPIVNHVDPKPLGALPAAVNQVEPAFPNAPEVATNFTSDTML